MRICICVFVPIHLRCMVLHTALCVQEACSACHAGEHFARQEISPKNVLRFDPLQILAFARKCSGQLRRNVFFIILFYHLTFMSISILFFIFTPFFGKVIIVKENYVFCASQQCRSWVSWEGLTKEIFCCRRWFSQILHKLTPFVKSPNIYFSLDTLDHKMGYFCIC